MPPVMSIAEWSERCASVKNAMREWVKRFVTPISMSVAPPRFARPATHETGVK